MNKTSFAKEKLFHFWFNTFFIGQENCEDNDYYNCSIEEEQNGVSTPRRNAAETNTHKCCVCKSDSLEKYLFLDIPLSELDRAYKDRQNKIYPASFKV